MKYFITGGSGFIGCELSKALLNSKNNFVTSVDIFENEQIKKLKKLNNYKFFNETILNHEFIETVISKSDIVIHLAAVAEPEKYVKNPRKVFEVNVKSSIFIIDQCIKHNCKILFSSTSEIYGKNQSLPFNEDDDRVLGSTSKHRWIYSTGKAIIEHYLNSLAKEKLINFLGIRIFNAYGPTLKGRLISKLISQAKKENCFEIHGDGSQKRCFIHISDLIEAIINLIENKIWNDQFYNIGNPKEEYSVLEIAKIIEKEINLKKINYKFLDRNSYGQGYEDLNRRVPSIEKIKNKINWSPKINIHEGIKDCIKNFGENETF